MYLDSWIMELFCIVKHEISFTQKAWKYGESQNGLCSVKTELQSKFCLETMSITLTWTAVTAESIWATSFFRLEQHSEETDQCQYLIHCFSTGNCHLENYCFPKSNHVGVSYEHFNISFQVMVVFHKRHRRKKTVLRKHDDSKKSLILFSQGKPCSQFHKLNDIVKSFSFSFFIFPRSLSLKIPFLSK